MSHTTVAMHRLAYVVGLLSRENRGDILTYVGFDDDWHQVVSPTSRGCNSVMSHTRLAQKALLRSACIRQLTSRRLLS